MAHRWKNLAYRAFSALLAIGYVALTPADATAQNTDADTVHADIARHLETEGLPGAVWTLVTPAGGIRTGAAGFKHAGTAQAMTPDARVHVGSVAKTVIAIGVLRLVTQGKLSLDTEVGSLLPALRFDNQWQATDPVRIRHLLEHTAGLNNFRFSQIFSLHAHADAPLSAALGDAPLAINTCPGARYVYSSIGYHLLGMVIEAVTGSRYERYLDAALLQPLGMHDSTFAFTTQVGAMADPRLAMGHFENGVAHPALPVHLRPATQLATTAADMGRLAQFLMGDGAIDGVPFVASELLAALGGAHDTDAARTGLGVGHGLALATRDRHQVTGDCHPGTMVGFQAMLCLYPAERKAFFVAANADVESADYDKLNKSLIAALQLTRMVESTSTTAPLLAMEEWSGIYVPAWNAVASLAWVDTVFNAVNVRWDGILLQLAPMQGQPASLRPAGGMLFQRGDRIAPSHVLFVTNGERMLSDGLRTYRQVPSTKMLWLWGSAVLGVVGLIVVLLRGAWLLFCGRLRSTSVLAVPLASVLLLLAPLPFFFTQSFLQLGDLTMASGLLALATCTLALGIAYGLVRLLMRGRHIRRPVLDCAALLAVMQWTIVLATWGMLPFVLWR